ncbi:MAG: F0F1 ATP synthase subunit alpha [Patescibacteria group bacterium]|jgi:F-type H+-transporting ATPase subunit alpha|nr:F0F1 ATP synthase subunit alpha [Patescibacteria group bacterium]MDD5173147.1 F0F1 ATP synthase subunit alpha [Patescibacteria group bacterium]
MSLEKIVDKLKKQIKEFEPKMEINETGKILEVGDGICRLSGLNKCQSSEMLLFPKETIGLALNLEEDSVGAVILGKYQHLKEGDIVKRTGQVLSIPVNDDYVGRIVDPLGQPLDGKEKIKSDKRYPIEKIAPGVMEREPVSQPLHTGIKAIDSSIPIGRGQRELIIGDRQTGKTAIAIDTIINQKNENIICIYVAIGQKQSKIANIVAKLKETGSLMHTIIVFAGASESAALSYLAPYAGATLAEYFMDQGKDVLIVYDDLSKHAWAYREISLLLRRPPGREAYPGDIFYLHSRLLERACRRNQKAGGGSITALPIIETQAGDVSAYIPTNVISITDGQIFLDSNLFYKGIRPAIDMGISVSRVGSSAQIKSMKKVAGKLKLDLAQFRELEAFTQFASDLDPETKKQISRGQKIIELLKQPLYSPLPISYQIISIYAVNNGYFDEIKNEEIRIKEKSLYQFLKMNKKELLKTLEKNWNEKIEEDLKKTLEEFKKSYL